METAAHAIAREPLCFPLCTIENFLRFQSQDKHNASSYFDMSRIDLLQSGCKNTHKKVENASFYDKSDSAEPALCFLPSSFTPHIHQGTPQEPSPPLWTAPRALPHSVATSLTSDCTQRHKEKSVIRVITSVIRLHAPHRTHPIFVPVKQKTNLYEKIIEKPLRCHSHKPLRHRTPRSSKPPTR